MADRSDGNDDGIGSTVQAGMRDSPDGDPRVLAVIAGVLSAVFAYVILTLLSLVTTVTFSWPLFGLLAVFLFTVVWMLTG